MDRPERTAGTAEPHAWHRAALALTFVFVLAAVFVSTGLVVYTAWNHELWNGLFALLFAVLSAKAALLWVAFRFQVSGFRHQVPGVEPQQKV